MAQNLSTDELRQLLAWLQSPVRAKFDKLAPQLNESVGKKLQDDVGANVNKDIQVMNQAVGTKLRIAVTANKQ